MPALGRHTGSGMGFEVGRPGYGSEDLEVVVASRYTFGQPEIDSKMVVYGGRDDGK